MLQGVSGGISFIQDPLVIKKTSAALVDERPAIGMSAGIHQHQGGAGRNIISVQAKHH